MKRFLACLLVLATLAGGSAFAAYPDVTDAETSRAVDALTILGIIDGLPDGTFGPSLTLTRSQFCKMAVMATADRDLVGRYKNYTIFPDVRSSHWAAGYINLAVKGSAPFIAGYPTGNFGPEDPITYAQAVTILMRLLGYTDSDVGMSWPDGYLATAEDIGLTAGLSLSDSSVVTRGEAALLFSHLLAAEMKDGGYYVATLSGSAAEGVILLSNEDDDGNIVTSDGTYTPAVSFSSDLVGERGILVLDKQGQALALISESEGARTTITVASASYSAIQAADGTRYNISATTPAYSGETSTTYENLWTDLAPGNRVSLYYNEAGKLVAVLRHTGSGAEAMAAKNSFSSGSNPFSSLVSGVSDYQIIKNGNVVSVSALRQYDSAYYDSAAKTLFVSDLRLSGSYDNVYPNATTPVRITMGGATFELLPSAVTDLAKFDLGDSITLLLTWDNRAAGVVSGSAVQSNAIAYVKSCTASSASVTLLNGLALSGDPHLSDYAAGQLIGQLAQVGTLNGGRLTLSRLTGSVSGTLNVASKKLGSTALASSVRVYEKVGGSVLTEISYGDLTQETIPSSAVSVAHKDAAGTVDILVLDDVTGDRYTYGILRCETSDDNATLTVENGGSAPTLVSSVYEDGMPAGIVGTTDDRVAGMVRLTKISGVPRSAFQDGTFSYESYVFPLDDNLDLYCYNKTTGNGSRSLRRGPSRRRWKSTTTVPPTTAARSAWSS
ncbi:MAG TPA: S-layer homology domain-containing protein [Oscillospiraceae bacterium]|nr:S-layer homology domain-containing protein [Oscillospiraceae bacterium]